MIHFPSFGGKPLNTSLHTITLLKWKNPLSICGTVHYHFWGYQDENLKLVIQQYRAWSLVRLQGCAGWSGSIEVTPGDWLLGYSFSTYEWLRIKLVRICINYKPVLIQCIIKEAPVKYISIQTYSLPVSSKNTSQMDHSGKICLQLAMWCRRCCLNKCARTDGRTDAGRWRITLCQVSANSIMCDTVILRWGSLENGYYFFSISVYIIGNSCRSNY